MIRRSQASASASPPPAAAPGSAAIVGLGIVNSLPAVARWLTRWRWIAPSMVLSPTVPSPLAAMRLDVAAARRSPAGAGEHDAFHRRSSSAPGELRRRAPPSSARVIALRASGRFSVSVRTPSSSAASRSVGPGVDLLSPCASVADLRRRRRTRRRSGRPISSGLAGRRLCMRRRPPCRSDRRHHHVAGRVRDRGRGRPPARTR